MPPPKTRYISDLHLGHRNILTYEPTRGGTCVKTHSEWLVEQWNSVVHPRDITWILGDICFDKEHLPYLDKMNGNKKMLWGNHDKFALSTYLKHFQVVRGFMRDRGYWFSHAPIHPDSLRDGINIHGHTHGRDVMREGLIDHRYVNVSVEKSDGKPRTLEELLG